MARPERHDVDYFPFMVKDGRTFFILEDKYQCKGIGFFTNMCRFLAQTPDHHYSIADEVDKMYFFSKVKCDEESGIDMLDIMAKTGKIHKQLWEKKRVIASNDFLVSVEDAYKNRKNNIITISEICNKYEVNNCSAKTAEKLISAKNTEETVEQIQPKVLPVFDKDFFIPEIAEIFYFKNFVNPESEAEKFWNHYNATGWKNKNGTPIENVLSVANNWEQKNVVGNKIPVNIMGGWKSVYSSCKPEINDKLLLLKLRPSKIVDNKMIIKIPNKAVFNAIEEDKNRLIFGNAMRKVFGANINVEYSI